MNTERMTCSYWWHCVDATRAEVPWCHATHGGFIITILFINYYWNSVDLSVFDLSVIIKFID